MSKGGSPAANCRLCLGPGPLTDEDISPTWMRKHIITKYGNAAMGQLPPRHKTRICRECNGRLGKLFENSSAPLLKKLIDTESVWLNSTDQAIIARWATKTVMLTCLGDSTPADWGYELARTEILRMMSSGAPPINTSVRLGRMETRYEAGGSADDYIGKLLPVNRMPQFAMFGLNIAGHLFYEVVIGIVPSQRYIHWIEGRTARFVKVWPVNEEGVAWPPSKKLYRHQVDNMRNVFMKARNPDVEVRDPRHRIWRIARG